jgi:hypothetical protein
MDPFTRRIIGFGIHRGTVDGPSPLFQRAIPGQALPKYLSTDNDPLYRFHPWQANLRVLEVVEIKTVPLCAAIASLCGAACWNSKERVPGSNLILDDSRPGAEAARLSRVFQ